MKINEEIRKYRILNGYSQEEMSKMLNISRTGYNRYENGNRKINDETLKKICNVLSINIMSLTSNSELEWDFRLDAEIYFELDNIIRIAMSRVEKLTSEEKKEFLNLIKNEYDNIEQRKIYILENIKLSTYEETMKHYDLSFLEEK